MKLAMRLRELREEKKCSMKQVAREVRISYGTYIHYEEGTRDELFTILVRLAKYYGVSVDYLLGLDDQRKEMQTPNADQRSKIDVFDHSWQVDRNIDYRPQSTGQDQQVIALGDYIRNRRKMLSLSQVRLAKLAGVSNVDICKLENSDPKNASTRVLGKIAPHLNTSYIQLLFLAGHVDGADNADDGRGHDGVVNGFDPQKDAIERIQAEHSELIQLISQVAEKSSRKEINAVKLMLSKLSDDRTSGQDKDLICGFLNKFA